MRKKRTVKYTSHDVVDQVLSTVTQDRRFRKLKLTENDKVKCHYFYNDNTCTQFVITYSETSDRTTKALFTYTHTKTHMSVYSSLRESDTTIGKICERLNRPKRTSS